MKHYNDTSYAAILLGNRLPYRLNKSQATVFEPRIHHFPLLLLLEIELCTDLMGNYRDNLQK
jgi:hypothetical protein